MSLAARLAALSVATGTAAIASTITPDLPSQLLAGFGGAWTVWAVHAVAAPDDDQDATQ